MTGIIGRFCANGWETERSRWPMILPAPTLIVSSEPYEVGAANALLLKVNQIGTVTEAKNAYLLARQAGWKVAVSARSGETEDNWLADLAIGWSGDFIKVGSITQSERLAKYNRLLMIEDAYELGYSK